jgi:large subunit ribosomal protein L29
MAKNKKQDLTALSDEELQNEIVENGDRLKKMKFSHAITPIENPKGITDIRRTVARLKTEVTRRTQLS